MDVWQERDRRLKAPNDLFALSFTKTGLSSSWVIYSVKSGRKLWTGQVADVGLCSVRAEGWERVPASYTSQAQKVPPLHLKITLRGTISVLWSMSWTLPLTLWCQTAHYIIITLKNKALVFCSLGSKPATTENGWRSLCVCADVLTETCQTAALFE